MEQNLLQELVAESIKINGVDVYYIPRTTKARDTSIKNNADAEQRAQKALANKLAVIDSDEPGKEAADEVAELFGSKVKVMKMGQGYKDACDYLRDNKSADFVKA